jgi:hypothetical protein
MSKASEVTQAWLEGLKKTGAISEDELKVLESSIAKPEVAEYVGASQLRQDEFSRKMNELNSGYQTKLQEVQNYERELANWRGTTEKSISQVQAELLQARAEAARIRQVAQTYGLDESDLGQPVAPYTTPPGTPGVATQTEGSNPNLQNLNQEFLSRKEADELGTMYTLLPAEINDIVAEHQELFGGKSPKGMKDIVNRAIKEKRSIRDVYEEQFKVADRRAELETQAREAEITRRVEEKLTSWRSEHPEVRLPRSTEDHASVLNPNLTAIPGLENVVSNALSQGVQQQDAVSAAVNFWNQIDREK